MKVFEEKEVFDCSVENKRKFVEQTDGLRKCAALLGSCLFEMKMFYNQFIELIPTMDIISDKQKVYCKYEFWFL